MTEGPKQFEREPQLPERYEHLVRWQGDAGGPDTPTASHARARLFALLATDLAGAVGDFNRATTRLNRILVWLTVALVALTGVLVVVGLLQYRALLPR